VIGILEPLADRLKGAMTIPRNRYLQRLAIRQYRLLRVAIAVIVGAPPSETSSCFYSLSFSKVWLRHTKFWILPSNAAGAFSARLS
jgi:hypothetical protein